MWRTTYGTVVRLERLITSPSRGIRIWRCRLHLPGAIQPPEPFLLDERLLTRRVGPTVLPA